MTKCIKCSKDEEEYKAQFPTTMYVGKKCETCGNVLFDNELFANIQGRKY
jgi:hypothetical protein